MTLWFTADHHFGHKNIIKYCNRPFSSIEEMDEVMIERWNSMVGKKDVVCYAGDFTLGNGDIAEKYFKKLNGNIIVVPGNHDWKWTAFDYKKPAYFRNLVRVDERTAIYNTKEDGSGINITVCHYAMRVWPFKYSGGIHLYGHSHGQTPVIQIPNSMDVGVDTNNFYPYSLDDVLEKLEYEIKP